MAKLIFVVTETNRDHIVNRIQAEAKVGDVVEVKKATRNLEQNAMLWPCLERIAREVVWYGQKLSPFEWKDIFSAALKKSKVIPGLDGGFVVCGQSTSKLNKSDFSELLELVLAFGAQNGIEWNLPVSQS